MVKFASLALFVLSNVLAVQACTWCQCLFLDSSHCCVMVDVEQGSLHCQTACMNAHRFDSFTDGINVGTPCAAGGSYKCVSGFTAQDRVPCFNPKK
ncbi:hypothetical protein DSL72_000146 [Monilinia vaccinii-corymbosi]|uniref:Uncharacterized protein n=1 Tax=Monilinia vaccinii-corymbosi TaxID=61207 RepID=A0A8A3P9C0_9HELO|nr:hypothetical protein DSL72_000146 [Monilinia vaccinii-corymbosi]